MGSALTITHILIGIDEKRAASFTPGSNAGDVTAMRRMEVIDGIAVTSQVRTYCQGAKTAGHPAAQEVIEVYRRCTLHMEG